MMLDVLHEYLGLTGARFGCGQGDLPRLHRHPRRAPRGPREIRTCITGAHYFAGRAIRTVEGHAEHDAAGNVTRLSPVQQAFVEHFAFQCGYCTPGFVTGAHGADRTAPQGAGCRVGEVERVVSQALRATYLPLHRLHPLTTRRCGT